MKMLQQETQFAPIAIVCETPEEAEALWELARFATQPRELSTNAHQMASKIGNWFSHEAKL